MPFYIYVHGHAAKGWEYIPDISKPLLDFDPPEGVRTYPHDVAKTMTSDSFRRLIDELAKEAKVDIDETSFSLVAAEESFRGFDFSRLRLRDSQFDNCDLGGANFENAIFQGVRFRRCDLRKTSFAEVELGGLELEDCKANGDTLLRDMMNPVFLTIDRVTLYRLGDSRGGLSGYDLSLAVIVDDLATLRAQFTGFRRQLNFLALLAFVSPYAIFVCYLWIGLLYPNPDAARDVTVLYALICYIASGGGDWEVGFDVNLWAMTLLVLMALYNAIRAVLFW